ncbi:MAG: DNA-binding protein WhiA [Oscillospiraceae bacterium]|jgi:DNA-binding protein WhiA
MSYSSDVKKELCRVPLARTCCALAEAYGVLLFCNTFSYREIRIITESRAFASRLPKLWKKAFALGFDRLPEEKAGGKLIFSVTDSEKIKKIFARFGYSPETVVAQHINLAVLEEECCCASFLRGAFLAGGSVTEPSKRYHLELVTPHYFVRSEALALMLENGLYPKDLDRNGTYIIYFKQSEYIEDMLTFIGAPVSAMVIMSTKVEKELRNSVNRRVNCDSANLDKAVEAAQAQLRAIRRLDLGALPEKLRRTAQLRLDNPEATLAELAEIHEPKVTKSCINHRLRKLTQLAEHIKPQSGQVD